jgi:hypothetical protein
MIWFRRAELYPGICLTTEEKHGKPQSGIRILLDTDRWVDLVARRGDGLHGWMEINWPMRAVG